MNGTVNGWIRDLRIVDTTEALGVGRDARRVTVEGVDVAQSIPIVGAAKPAEFPPMGRRFSSIDAAQPATASSTLRLARVSKDQT